MTNRIRFCPASRGLAGGFAFFSAAAAGLAATITVSSAADVAANDGLCTLREAITAANTNTASGAAVGECVAGVSGLDTIQFNSQRDRLLGRRLQDRP
jgi:CSLREA domain-containing protein